MTRAALLLIAAISTTGATSSQQPVPRVGEQRVDWNWGELLYGRSYRGTLSIENKCGTTQKLLIDTAGAPELRIDRFVTLPPQSVSKLPYRITPRQLPGRLLDGEVRAELIVWHPRGADCAAYRVQYHITGRARLPSFHDAAREWEAAKSAAVDAACRLWWLRGEVPGPWLAKVTLGAAARSALALVSEERCTALIRSDSSHLRQEVLERDARHDPDAWRWLPNQATIDRSTLVELIQFRQRVGALIVAR